MYILVGLIKRVPEGLKQHKYFVFYENLDFKDGILWLYD